MHKNSNPDSAAARETAAQPAVPTRKERAATLADASKEFNEGLRQAPAPGQSVAAPEPRLFNQVPVQPPEDDVRRREKAGHNAATDALFTAMFQQAMESACRGASTQAAAVKLVATMQGWFWQRYHRSEDFARPMPDVDYLSALNVLRRFGWSIGIQAALGFVLHHSRDENVLFDRVRGDLEAYCGKGRAFLLEEAVYLHDPLRDEADLSTYRRVSLEEVRLAPKSYNRPTPAWRVLWLHLLPDPLVPYVGEREDRLRYSCLSELLVRPEQISNRATQQSKSTETLTEAGAPVAPDQVPGASASAEAATLVSSRGKMLESWKEILPETNKRLGREVSEKTARELFKKHGIILEERRGFVRVWSDELTKLPDQGSVKRLMSADPSAG